MKSLYRDSQGKWENTIRRGAVPNGEMRLCLSARIPLQPLSRISKAIKKRCAKGRFNEKYNNNLKYSSIERRLLPCLPFTVPGSALCECSIGAASSVGVVKTKLGLAAHKLDRAVCLCDFLFLGHEVNWEIWIFRHNGKTRTFLRWFFVYQLISGSAKEAGDVGGIIT